LTASLTVGTGPINGVFAAPNVFSGDTLALSGKGLYRGTSLLGTVAAADANTSFAASSTEAVFATGGALHRTDGAALTTPAFPDGAQVLAVAVLASRFLAVRGSSQRFYWSNLLDGTTWDGLSYASAESRPDNLLDIKAVGDELALLGQNSIEFWQPTADLNLPYQKLDGRSYTKGVLNTGASWVVDNGLFWVGDDGIVYRSGAVPQRVSDHAIETQITASGWARLWSFVWVGHTYLVLKLATKTYLFDIESEFWSEATSYGFAGWRVQCGHTYGQTTLFGDGTTGNVYTLSDGTLVDGDATIERRFTALVPANTIIDTLMLDAQAGLGVGVTGNPIIEVSASRDDGVTFGPFRQAQLGMQGHYRTRAAWRRLGLFDYPGGVLDFRTTDPSPFSVQGLRFNEPLTGRSR
jgi:hypothetical protein